MVMSNICYRCGKEMDGYYVEEGDLTISSKRLVCPHCGWVLEGVFDSHEQEDHQTDQNTTNHKVSD